MHCTKSATAMLSAVLAIIACQSSSAGESHPGAVKIARATELVDCTLHVDAAAKTSGNGSAQSPFVTIAAAVAAAEPGAVICVTEGTYAEQLAPGEKAFTLAGGYKRGSNFKVRDSAAFVSKAVGHGGSFLRIADLGPKGQQLTAIDGFEITGYSHAIVREFYESQRFDITNNFIHDNVCTEEGTAGAGFALNNVSGTIKGNVIQNNSCARGGAGFLNDAVNENTVSIENNIVDGNAGTEPGSAHGGGLYLFGNTLKIVGNLITNNTVTMWGGGLYIGAFRPGNQPTTATLANNIYRGNRAGDSGGGFFCDDGATCIASHEIYDSNCGGNILVDGGSAGSGPTVSKFDHITNVRALTPACDAPGDGIFVDTFDGLEADNHTVTNAIFYGNAEKRDIATSCGSGCSRIKVSAAYSMLQTAYTDGSIKVSFGRGMVPAGDPLFIALDAGNFQLQPTSPAIGRAADGSDLGAHGNAAAAALPAPAAAPVKVAAAADEVGSKEAFEAAKELGTTDAWNAFLKSYPSGFHAGLARAYLKKLDSSASQPAHGKKGNSAAKAPSAAGELQIGANTSLGGRRLLPDDSPWHQDISQAAVDENSAKILAGIGMGKPLRADFGPEWEGAPVGIPYVVVGADQEKVPVTFTDAEESDAGPYPIPPDAPIEGGPKGEGDRHVLVLDRDASQLWELYDAKPDGNGGWAAGSGAVWNLKENQVRPAGWTSADAAGLPILPGLVRYDEVVEKGALDHALRFTLKKSRRAYVPPASHWASKLNDVDLPPMGMRVRLKADYDTAGFGPEAKVILEALKKYGMILANNGSDFFISGAPDERWNVDALRELMRVTTKDLEIIEMTGMVVDKREK